MRAEVETWAVCDCFAAAHGEEVAGVASNGGEILRGRTSNARRWRRYADRHGARTGDRTGNRRAGRSGLATASDAPGRNVETRVKKHKGGRDQCRNSCCKRTWPRGH